MSEKWVIFSTVWENERSVNLTIWQWRYFCFLHHLNVPPYSFPLTHCWQNLQYVINLYKYTHSSSGRALVMDLISIIYNVASEVVFPSWNTRRRSRRLIAKSYSLHLMQAASVFCKVRRIDGAMCSSQEDSRGVSGTAAVILTLIDLFSWCLMTDQCDRDPRHIIELLHRVSRSLKDSQYSCFLIVVAKGLVQSNRNLVLLQTRMIL